MGQRRRPVTSFEIPRVSFCPAGSHGLVVGPAFEGLRVLSQSATATFKVLASLLRASFAPD